MNRRICQEKHRLSVPATRRDPLHIGHHEQPFRCLVRPVAERNGTCLVVGTPRNAPGVVRELDHPLGSSVLPTDPGRKGRDRLWEKKLHEAVGVPFLLPQVPKRAELYSSRLIFTDSSSSPGCRLCRMSCCTSPWVTRSSISMLNSAARYRATAWARTAFRYRLRSFKRHRRHVNQVWKQVPFAKSSTLLTRCG